MASARHVFSRLCVPASRMGGVDTEVQLAMTGEPTGYLHHPTCWQYKARRYADIWDKTFSPKLKALREEADRSRLCLSIRDL